MTDSIYHFSSAHLTIRDQAAQQVEQGFRLSFNELRALGEARPVGVSRAAASQAVKRRGALLQGVDSRPQCGVHGFGLLRERGAHTVGVADTAFESEAAAFPQFPQ